MKCRTKFDSNNMKPRRRARNFKALVSE